MPGIYEEADSDGESRGGRRAASSRSALASQWISRVNSQMGFNRNTLWPGELFSHTLWRMLLQLTQLACWSGERFHRIRCHRLILKKKRGRFKICILVLARSSVFCCSLHFSVVFAEYVVTAGWWPDWSRWHSDVTMCTAVFSYVWSRPFVGTTVPPVCFSWRQYAPCQTGW